ncbi:MAG: hypothetical protein PF436_11450 [Prolixibacteraceae bacterium]|jgi:hypothetical protein|nr:hypothetical protein [Prolixibacteraceae bacterium]
MKALIKSRKIAVTTTIVGASVYFILDMMKSRVDFVLIDFFRGFFTGLTLSTLLLFIVLTILRMIKQQKNEA